ncbi:MAG: hypothetical protein ACRDWA_12470 [Acidimicrobiia bacterium]
MRRWLSLGGALLILFGLALPAQAGLGDLFDEILDDPVSDLTAPLAPLVETLPIIPETVDLVDETVAPVVAVVDEVASPVVTVVDEVASPITNVVEEIVTPVVEPVVGVVEPVVKVVDPVVEVVDPVIEDLPPVIPSTDRPPIDTSLTTTPAPSSPDGDEANLAPVSVTPALVQAATVTPASIQRLLLASLRFETNDETTMVWDRGETRFIPGEPLSANWLDALGAWLGSALSSLFDVLAIPAHLFELLLRALSSAGAGLVAPAAIFAALAVGGRRRLLPVS